jgi:hypothetical protein
VRGVDRHGPASENLHKSRNPDQFGSTIKLECSLPSFYNLAGAQQNRSRQSVLPEQGSLVHPDFASLIRAANFLTAPAAAAVITAKGMEPAVR